MKGRRSNMPSSFNNLIRSEIVLAINTGSNELVVKECAEDAVLKQLTIHNLPQNAFAFELDHKPAAALKRQYNRAFDQLSCLIQGGHANANKKCDLILIVEEQGSYHAIIADLKSTSPDRADCKRQLRNSELYFIYLMSLMKEYHNSALKIDSVHKVVFYATKRVLKAVVQQKNSKDYEKKDGVKFYPVLLGGKDNSQGRAYYRAIVS
jgi:hypothetical protein